jgi:predicted enzyme related to lactoylglutathione lyase
LSLLPGIGLLEQLYFCFHFNRCPMKSVEIIMLPVADRQKAKEFYLQLGFEIRVEAPAAHGETWIQMGLPGAPTTISLAGFQGVVCEVEDITAKISDLQTIGIEVGQIDETPWGRFAWLKDLDGNSLCLHQK